MSPNWLNHALASLPVELTADYFALLTSGSTGEPKLVIDQRLRAEQLTRALHELQESGPVAETILALPPTYNYSFVTQWVWARCHDRRLVPTPDFEAGCAAGGIMAGRRREHFTDGNAAE